MREIDYARPADFPGLAELERKCFSQPWSKEALNSFEENGGLILVFREEGAVTGYVSAVFAADEGEIVNLAVAPGSRRRGIASRLLDSAAKEAGARGAKALFLDVRASNEAAIALYEKKGFFRVGSRKGFYQEPKEDSFIYRKDLV